MTERTKDRLVTLLPFLLTVVVMLGGAISAWSDTQGDIGAMVARVERLEAERIDGRKAQEELAKEISRLATSIAGLEVMVGILVGRAGVASPQP